MPLLTVAYNINNLKVSDRNESEAIFGKTGVEMKLLRGCRSTNRRTEAPDRRQVGSTFFHLFASLWNRVIGESFFIFDFPRRSKKIDNGVIFFVYSGLRV